MRSEPRSARTPVWALSVSLAATPEITVVFFSSGYLDVSVHRVPGFNLWIQLKSTKVFLVRFPHSDICGSMCICHSPQLFAAYHVFLRLLVPRHPPCALRCFTTSKMRSILRVEHHQCFNDDASCCASLPIIEMEVKYKTRLLSHVCFTIQYSVIKWWFVFKIAFSVVIYYLLITNTSLMSLSLFWQKKKYFLS